MKKVTLLLLLCTCFTCFSLRAQVAREKIKALKVAHITETLQLSSEEAQKFWPVYNAYEEKTLEYRVEKFRGIKRELKDQNIDEMSEAEAEKLLSQTEATEEKLYTERRELIKNLKKIISAKKILLLKKAEDDFNKKLLRQLKERRERRFNRN